MKPSDPEETRYLIVKPVLRGSGASRYYEGIPINPEDVHIQTIEEAEPIKHAHWIKEKHKVFMREIFTCSNCGNSLDFSGVNAGRGSANYCPNCGAKMDDEEND